MLPDTKYGYFGCAHCARPNNTIFKYCEACRIARRRRSAKYDKTPKSKAVNDRWNGSLRRKHSTAKYAVDKMVERNRKSVTWSGHRLNPIQMFCRLTGMTEEQLNFPRR
jgi:hypothetical protein